ncbi:Mor transcription activator family protein [Rhodanobacter sp. AS-Z3]|jgi:Mor family transcriptional regulator|uniref:Mor transcription activator family protein n=1 Tax=Rhodanobacter sp. AS-Z3 TaxID=3031330 RepID=UPI00247A0DDD|nr:Mor transcription activator family protein [Rhodanobacter sp. AS-Z3]WEN13691.1 Mor transcription activator family protein [Rhodanobacter sp. AS-Z3]
MAHLDLVADILQRIGLHAKLPAKVAQAVEREVRDDWGGERHYIAKVGESGKAQLTERDKQIRDAYRQGEHIELLARRHGISVKRVQQIVAIDAGNALP